MKHTLILASLVAVAACGGKSAPPSGGPTPPEGKRMAWADMDHEQREEYMEHTVMPVMKAKFVEFDAEEFADFDCKTCHSKASMEDHSFKMPNRDIYQLDFSKKPEDYSPEEQKTGHFMDTVVVPEMAKLLDTTPYDMEKQTGFGCLGCHTAVNTK